MSDLRIHLPPIVPKAPGTLESLTISLLEGHGRVQEPILKFALEKWTSLYTIRVLSYAISEMFVVLLAFVPAEAPGEEEARERCEAFDKAQKERRARLGITRGSCRKHNWSGSKLRNLSHFMGVFTHDLGLLHRNVPEELRERCGKLRPVRFRCRFKVRTVSHEAVPWTEGWMDLKALQAVCGDLGFKTPAGYIEPGEMVLSDYAFGRKEFVDAVIDARNRALLGKRRAPKYARRRTKNGREDMRCLQAVAPPNAAAFVQRVEELAAASGGWEPPGWLDMLDDTVRELRKDLSWSISWGIEDMLVHRVTPHSAVLPYSVPAWVVAMLMDGMIRVYYWRSRRKWEKAQQQAQAQAQPHGVA